VVLQWEWEAGGRGESLLKRKEGWKRAKLMILEEENRRRTTQNWNDTHTPMHALTLMDSTETPKSELRTHHRIAADDHTTAVYSRKKITYAK
jgi:hypothetical protein